ncbi:hypothetical protein ONZ45_g13561 [Pleurotus djamor]|nr:hypothetical protein ONZ45_g13561 [Pleurotus djamor]
MYAKVGLYVDMNEAHALHFLNERVVGPIPRLVDAISVRSGAFIVMTGLPGKPLEDRLCRMSSHQRSLLALDIKEIFDQLRSIPPPREGPRICAVDGGAFRCFRVTDDRIGPFTTEMDFYRFLYARLWLPEQERLQALAEPVHTRTYPLCLHHNDLAPQNILVDDQGRLSGLIDWAGLAWFPQYWEWTRSYYATDAYHEWQALLDEIFGRWEEELAVEQEFWRFSSPF